MLPQATLGFSLDLLRVAEVEDANLALSPASVALALGMTMAGARGETQAELARVLRCEADPEGFHADAQRLLRRWPDRGDPKIRIANRLFGDAGRNFLEGFVRICSERYDAPLQTMDLRRDAEAARLEINAWVTDKTEGLIRNLVPPNTIRPDSDLMLVTALYLLAGWRRPFDKGSTHDAPFHLEDGSIVQVSTMRREDGFAQAELGGLQLVELPYRDGNLVMSIVMPPSGHALSSIVADLKPEDLIRLFRAARERDVNLFLPRLEMNASSLSLKSALQKLGMARAYDPDRADFSAMVESSSHAEKLHLDDLIHQVYLRVDEEGTEAAAAAALGCRLSAPYEPVPELRVDGPYLLFLRERASGVVWFAGRVTNPLESAGTQE